MANPEEWRSGINNGVPQDFDQSFGDTYGSRMFEEQRVEVSYRKQANLNVQETTTWTSIASRGAGATSGASLDAVRGIKTSVKRLSSTTVVNDLRPDSVNSPTTQTIEQSTLLNLNTNSYITPPDAAANYELEESIPVPLLSTDAAEVEGWVADYVEYLTRFTKGDLYGLQIGESMRSEIVTGWYPGRPFRYVDNGNSKISAMRMDACSWGVTSEEAIVMMNGVWNGFSNGTLVLGDNLTGNSSPDMGTLVANPNLNGVTSASNLSQGSGYTDGVYEGVSLTSGSGTGATGTIEVVGGEVVSVNITDGGQGYTEGDTLSALDGDLGGGGGSGFGYTVTGVDERQTVPDAPTAPPGASAPPSITDDVVGQSFAFTVEVNLNLESYIFFYGEDGVIAPNPTDLTGAIDLTLIPWVGGLVVEAGGLVETTGTGSIPLDNDGLIVTTTATVVNDNLFA